MLVEEISAGSASVSIMDGFKVLIGKVARLDSHHLWLMSEPGDITLERVNEILASGVRIGCVFPVWMSLSIDARDLLRDCTHIFQSFGVPWSLPCGFTVYPVSSGFRVGGTNWLFKSGSSGSTLLVCGPTCIEHNSYYTNAFAPGRGQVTDKIDQLFQLTGSDPQPELSMSISSVCDLVTRSTGNVNISAPDVVTTVAVVLALAHHIDILPIAQRGRILIYDDYLTNHIFELPPLFEWVSKDLQVYLLKCIHYIANENRTIAPVPLADLAAGGLVRMLKPNGFELEGPPPIVTIAGVSSQPNWQVFDPVPPSTHAEVQAFYKPSGISVTREESCVPHRSLTTLQEVVSRRFNDAIITNEGDTVTVSVPSSNAMAVFRSDRLAELEVGDDDSIEFIHLVS